jgi:gamma-glutamyltranspeptidase/glutathione hydrolase
MKTLLLAAALTAPLAVQAAPAAQEAAISRGVVTSADPRATEAGQDILRQGGTATDAAMAMMLALTVVEPQSSGIGGGGFLVHNDGRTGKVETIDGRETAPAADTSRLWLGPDGQPLPFAQAFPGGRSVGVPGNVRLLAEAHKRWGKLPWKALFQPAIRLAEQGYAATPPLVNGVRIVSPLWADTNFDDARALYGDAKVGETIRNPRLATLLRTLSEQGPDAFYTGDNAAELLRVATQSRVAPSAMTAADLAGYRAIERAPVCGTYRRYRICSMAPPSSGGVTVLQILGMLERFDLRKLGKDSPVAWHLIAEAMQLAYADRDTYLGDPAFVRNPVAGLIAPAYLRQRSALIAPDHSLGTYLPGHPAGAGRMTAAVSSEVPATTHFIAVDKRGDIATMTSTVEGPFGSQLIANGYVLNNELTDFTFAPEKDGAPVANRPEGGKRPLSSMAPTIVYDRDGKAIFSVGAAGGRTIIMQVAKALIAHLDWGMPAREALGTPLVFFNSDGLVLEQGTWLTAMKPALETLGHRVTIGKLGLKANAVERTPRGWVGAADPRSVGTALSE